MDHRRVLPRRRFHRRRIHHREIRTVVGDRIFAAAERAVPIPQLGGVGIQQQTEIRRGVGEPSPNDGCHIPLLESRRLIDVLRRHRRPDVCLRQRDVVITTRIRRPGIDAVVRVACCTRQNGVLVDDRVRGDGIGRIGRGVTRDEIERQGCARDGRSRRNARKIKLHQNGIGRLRIWPGIQIELRFRRIVAGIDVEIRVPSWLDYGGGRCLSQDCVRAGSRRRGGAVVAAGVQQNGADREHCQGWDECVQEPRPMHERLLDGSASAAGQRGPSACIPRATAEKLAGRRTGGGTVLYQRRCCGASATSRTRELLALIPPSPQPRAPNPVSIQGNRSLRIIAGIPERPSEPDHGHNNPEHQPAQHPHQQAADLLIIQRR